MPKGFKRIRYYGVQATKTFAKVKVVIHRVIQFSSRGCMTGAQKR